MTNAGWYPDPAGAPDTYRYWDGQSWSQMTTSHPPAAAQEPTPQPPQQPQQPSPPAAAPTQFPPQQFPQQPQQSNQGGYGAVPQPPTPTPAYGTGGFSGGSGGYPQQQWSPQPSGGSGGSSGKVIGIVIAAVLVLVLLGVGGFFGVRALSGDDDDNGRADDPSQSESSDSSESSSPTDGTDPTDVPTNTVAPTGIQCTGGTPEPAKDPGATPATITGGGLTIPVPSGYTVDVRLSPPHSFADGVLVAYKSVEENWITEFAVGGLPRTNGFNDVADAAEIIMKCLTTNDDIYEGFSERKDLSNEAITVDGKPAHRITAEIKVDNPDVVAEGDVTTVIVVDTGDTATFGLFLGVATIGEPTSIALVDSQIKAIKVG
ncbi:MULTISPECIES: DUF2510 domain-containing protein [unclassified Nocardioides]|uniref:DUF2510 domain-containing protein n=1 Tax=unclassified Nocardioides TaxID=2615069 RepID=UPI0006F6273F|nr:MULTISPECIES: DUF2510 domain-containing protein [unclassified Nocardioides]KRA29809.1 hypothetical protein ASD81_19020 [Nocardioides sp. Root614]KRA86732.1 hypothetical protein ASD84_21245 [Nocardioides sp. Root682]